MNQKNSQTVPLSDELLSQLQQQRNTAEQWDTVRVAVDFTAEHVYDCQFSGAVELGSDLELRRSTVVDCQVGNGVAVVDSYISGYTIGAQATVTQSTLIYDDGCHVDGMVISAVPESGERPITLSSKCSFTDYIAQHQQNGRASNTPEDKAVCGHIGKGARITDGARIRDSWIGAGATVSNAQVENSYLARETEPKQRVIVDRGALVANSILMAGTHISSHAFVEHSHIFECARISHHALISHAIIAPNCHLERGEIRASIIGPLVNLHHNSMLISVYWPEGRGNVGSGALYGANHTTRKANQECHLPEGFWAGLRSSAVMPIDLRRAPYLTVAATVDLHPQRIRMPFALIVPGDIPASPPEDEDQTGATGRKLCRILPAWAIYCNLYALLRSWYKHTNRDTVPQYKYQHSPFREDLLNSVLTAQEALERCRDTDRESAHYTAEHIPEIGECYLLSRDLSLAKRGYKHYIEITRHLLQHGTLPEIAFLLAKVGIRKDKVTAERIFDNTFSNGNKTNTSAKTKDEVVEYFLQQYSD